MCVILEVVWLRQGERLRVLGYGTCVGSLMETLCVVPYSILESCLGFIILEMFCALR